MTESDYQEIIAKSLQRFQNLYEQREDIDVELVKLRQFLYATLNMMPDGERSKWEAAIDDAVRKATANTASLADSIRRVFEDNPEYIFTLGGIREKLMEAGFDFSSYKSNPLSSISTTLRRMVEMGELESKEDAVGTTGYIRRERPKRRRTLAELAGEHGEDHPLRKLSERPKSLGEKIADARKKPKFYGK
jgi:hypothetical protein